MLAVEVICWPQHANADILINGAFENTDGWGAPGDIDAFPSGWGHITPTANRNAAKQQSGIFAIGGAGTSALVPVPEGGQTRRLDQVFAELSQWKLEFDFAVEDAGEANNRSLSMTIHGSTSNALISTRVNGEGEFQLFDNGGSGWHTPTGLEQSVTMSSSVDTSGLIGDYNNDLVVDAADYTRWRDNLDSKTILSNDPIGGTIGVAQYDNWKANFGATIESPPIRVNHLEIIGDFTTTPPKYDVIVTDADGTVRQALGLTDVWNSPAGGPAVGTGITGISFVAGTQIQADYLLDNVSLVSTSASGLGAITTVPEPSSALSLYLSAGLCGIARRRRMHWN